MTKTVGISVPSASSMQVVGRVGVDAGDGAPLGAVGRDDRGADQLVGPEGVVVVDGLAVDDLAGQGLGGLAGVDAVERGDPLLLERPDGRDGDGTARPGSTPPRAQCARGGQR